MKAAIAVHGVMLGILIMVTGSNGRAQEGTAGNLVGKTWYCTDNYQGVHRYVFNQDGTFSEAFFTPTPKGLKFWNPGATKIGYSIASPTQIKILDSSFNPPFLSIQSLTPQQLSFSQGTSSYSCTHTPPPGDTPANAAAVASERATEMRFFNGKWLTKDGLQSVEFFPNGTCEIISHVKGNSDIDISMYKGTVHGNSSLYSGGSDIQCAGSPGAFSRVGPNKIDFSVQSASISLYRVQVTKPSK